MSLNPSYRALVRSLIVASLLAFAVCLPDVRAQLGCESSALNSQPFSVRTMSGEYTVFEANRNPLLPAEEKCYFVAPIVFFESTDGVTPDVRLNEYGDFATVTVPLIFDYPSPEEVAAALRRGDPHDRPVTSRNVSRLAPRTIRVEHPIFETENLVQRNETASVAVASDGYNLLLETKAGRSHLARPFVRNFRRGGESLRLSYLIFTAEASATSIDVRWQNIASSEGFAEFEHMVRGKKILASQALDAAMIISRELKATLWQEYEDADQGAFLDLALEVSRSLLAAARKSFVDVRDLRDMLAPYQVDLTSDNFQPSVITTFVADVKNLSNREFSNKYFRDYSYALRQEKDRNLEAGAKMSIFKIFGGGAKYKQEFHDMSDSELKDRLERENYFREDLDRSFRVEMNGNIIQRVEVLAYENLNLHVDRIGHDEVISYRVRKRAAWIPLALSSSRVRQRRIGDWRNAPISLGGA